jgi:septum formation protein
MMVWSRLDRHLVLASASPRRREILERLGFSFEVRSPRVDNETAYVRVDDLPGSLAELALAKARSPVPALPAALVLGGDTVVARGARVMGKPRDREEGAAMLRELAGAEHEVVSGVALACEETGFEARSHAVTRVRFRPLRPEEIDCYLDTGEYADKAGAYAIQGKAMAFVERIEGCYYNVVGLPVRATLELFEKYRSRKGE